MSNFELLNNISEPEVKKEIKKDDKIELLKARMKEAVENSEYEKASEIQDQINKLKQTK